MANRTGIIRPDAASANPVTTSAYDVTGNLVQSTDALGRTTWRQYDALGRLTAETSPLGRLRRRARPAPPPPGMWGFAPRQSAARKLD
jgi:YD repeat-containing protein